MLATEEPPRHSLKNGFIFPDTVYMRNQLKLYIDYYVLFQNVINLHTISKR